MINIKMSRRLAQIYKNSHYQKTPIIYNLNFNNKNSVTRTRMDSVRVNNKEEVQSEVSTTNP